MIASQGLFFFPKEGAVNFSHLFPGSQEANVHTASVVVSLQQLCNAHDNSGVINVTHIVHKCRCGHTDLQKTERGRKLRSLCFMDNLTFRWYFCVFCLSGLLDKQPQVTLSFQWGCRDLVWISVRLTESWCVRLLSKVLQIFMPELLFCLGQTYFHPAARCCPVSNQPLLSHTGHLAWDLYERQEEEEKLVRGEEGEKNVFICVVNFNL